MKGLAFSRDFFVMFSTSVGVISVTVAPKACSALYPSVVGDGFLIKR